MVLREVSAGWVLGHQVFVLQVWVLALESEAATGGFPSSRARCRERERRFGEAQYPGRPGDGAPSNVLPATGAVPNQAPAGPPAQVDHLIALLANWGCSEAALGEVQQAVKAKAKPRVVQAAEHAVVVLER